MQFSSSDYFRLFFGELERQDVPYVLLHSYEQFPAQISSDVDFAIPTRDLPRLPRIQSDLAESHGWRLAQVIEAHIYALYSVVLDPKESRAFLQLDACGHYVENDCFFLSDKVILHDPRRFREFYIPAPPTEFAYLLSKSAAKAQPFAPRLARLRELWQSDPSKVEERFQELCGRGYGTLREWFSKSPSEWESLRPVLLRRHRFSLGNRMREACRILKRMAQPEGLHLAVLGPDGCGKSTLIDRVGPMIQQPIFRRQVVVHFRPKIFEGNRAEVPVINPHEKPPRGRFATFAKLLYYCSDNIIGHFIKVLPAKARDELIIFCRNFDDLLIDPRRYRLNALTRFTRWLRRLVPQPDLTFVLDADPEEIPLRKPELPLDEIGRQRSEFKLLAGDHRRYIVINAEAAPEAVASLVYGEVSAFLAAREKDRAAR